MMVQHYDPAQDFIRKYKNNMLDPVFNVLD